VLDARRVPFFPTPAFVWAMRTDEIRSLDERAVHDEAAGRAQCRGTRVKFVGRAAVRLRVGRSA
jgi:hypothetical protein